MPENNIFDPVVAAGIRPAVHCNATGILIDIKHQCVTDQLVMNYENGTAVSSNRNVRGRIPSSIPFIPAIVVPSQVGSRRSIDCRSHLAGRRAAVVIHIGGRISIVVVLLQHVHDGVVYVFSGPFRVKRGVSVDSHRTGNALGKGFIRIPAFEGVAVAGWIRFRKTHACAIGHRRTGNVASAVGLIAELEVLTGIVDRKLLFGLPVQSGRLDDGAFRALKNGIFVGLDFRSHVAVQDTTNVARSLDLGVPVVFEIFQIVYKVVYRGKWNVLETDSRFQIVIEIAFFNRDGRRFRIVNRRAGDLVGGCLRGGRSGNRIRNLVVFSLKQVRVEDEILASVIYIIVFGRDLVDLNGTEDRYRSKASIDDRISRYLFFSPLFDPLLEYLSGHEGILRHGPNGFSSGAKVLGEAFIFTGTGIRGENHEVHIELIFKLSNKSQVGCDRLAAIIFGLTYIPTLEILAFNHRISGKLQFIILVVSICLVCFAFNIIGDGKDILIVVRPNGQRSISFVALIQSTDPVVKARCFAIIVVHPGTNRTGFRWDIRNVIQAVAGVRSNGFGRYYLRLVFIIESDRIGDLGMFRNDDRVRRRDP